MKNRILRIAEVKALTGLSRSSVYAFIAEENFPKQLKLGRRSVGWRFEDVQKWLDSRKPTEA